MGRSKVSGYGIYVERILERGNTYVCSVHFTWDCFEPTMEIIPGFKKRKMLKPSAVPTIFAFPTKLNENKTRPSSVKQIENRAKKVWKLLIQRSNIDNLKATCI